MIPVASRDEPQIIHILMKSLAFILILFIAVTNLNAWSGPGHMTVAAIAYRDLKPEEQKQITEILAQHWEYPKWHEVAAKGVDEGLILMMGASTWPDLIKFGHSHWNHKEWHYVDYPVTPADFAIKASPSPENDIVFAIDLIMKNLKDKANTSRDKACWMALLIHLVGDIHQPLHCCALINPDFPAPLGDRGGNLIMVRGSEGRKGIAIHKMWDDAGGTSQGFYEKQVRKYLNQATEWSEQTKRAACPEIKQHTISEHWARKTWGLAVEHAYLQGALRYGKTAEATVVLPEGYTK